MEFRVLGPLEVVVNDAALHLGGPRQRTVLALLLLNANRVTPLERLVDAVWGEAPPSTARTQIQTCISGLRRGFARDAGAFDVITTRDAGYLLCTIKEQLDSERFSRGVEAARGHAARGAAAAAERELRESLALWRGPALMGVHSDVVRRSATLLDELRLAALEELHELNLALGRHVEAVSELFELIEREPLRERLYGFLMLALYRAGRQAEALDVYRRARTALIGELGIEPGRELRRLEVAILNGDASLDAPSRPVVRRAAPPEVQDDPSPVPPASPGTPPERHQEQEGGDPREESGPPAAAVDVRPAAPPPGQPLQPPRQLPRDIGDFTGREEYIEQLRGYLTPGAGGAAARHSVPVIGIVGTGGIGKSALAVHAAHELAGFFPDGQLYADLHGVSDTRTVAGVMDRFLRALGVSSHAVPEEFTERTDLYRSRLACQRVLVVLDDIADGPELQHLIPGSASCAVIMTSRSRLAAITAIRRIGLPVFDRDLSVELLSRIAGRGRVETELAETFELAEVCAGLPLALRIAGARLAYRPHWRVGRLVRRLRDEAGRLDEFAHAGMELRSTIGLAYRGLDEDAQRMLRLLSLLGVRTFPGWVAAALADMETPDAEDILDTLVDVQLVDVMSDRDDPSTRYQVHDLIKVYAKERCQETETPEECAAALRRLLRTWLTLAEAMHRREYGGDFTILHGTEERRTLPAEATAELLDGPMERWARERHALVWSVRQAAESGLHELCWDLAHTAVTLYEAKGYTDDWRETSELGLAAVRAAGNTRGEAVMLYSLGSLHMYQARLDAAEELFVPAKELFDAVGDTHGSALVLRNMGFLERLRGDREAMMTQYEIALGQLRALGDRVGEAHVLCGIAAAKLDDGEAEEARPLLTEALEISRSVGCARIEAQVIYRLGDFHLRFDEAELAGQAFQQALRIVRATSDVAGEAHVLYGIGRVWVNGRQPGRAKQAFTEALGAAERAGDLLIHGQARLALGQAEHELGEHAAALETLTAAAETFAHVGAALWQGRALVAKADVHAVLTGSEGDEQACLKAAAKLLVAIESAEAAEVRDLIERRLLHADG
ncbi:BTAD domain-containing putative transcriptional regulator [Streptomyces sp. NPDC050504]|uniref:AfsR/SARP family transcriptional regulator n=1 Tax=Streptomyces sp. NPDC050504 TaxID=3365618 RepID=UPI00378C064F